MFYTLELIGIFVQREWFLNKNEEKERLQINVVYLRFLINWIDLPKNVKLQGEGKKFFWIWLVGPFRGKRLRILDIVSSKVLNTERSWSTLEDRCGKFWNSGSLTWWVCIKKLWRSWSKKRGTSWNEKEGLKVWVGIWS